MNSSRPIILKQNSRWKIDTNDKKKVNVNKNSKTPWSRNRNRNRNRNNHSRRPLDNERNDREREINISDMNFPSLSSNIYLPKKTVWSDSSKQKNIKKSGIFINMSANYCSYTKKKIKKGIEIIGMKNLSDTKLYFDGLNNLKRYNHLHNCNLKRLEVDSNGNKNLFEVSSIVDNDYQEPFYSEEEYYSEDEYF
jgi:hypothetical protein